MDTIYALASGSLPAGIAIVRLSGPATSAILQEVAGDVKARKASLRRLRSNDGTPIDEALVLFFAGPNSFTGEDVAEFHLHGGRAVVNSLFAALERFPGTRQAEAGEFSKRAFLNGRLDLSGAEALGDLIAAETEAQRRLAFQGHSGSQLTVYAEFQRRLTIARAEIEADLDFADEEDVPATVIDNLWLDLLNLADEIDALVKRGRSAEIIQSGYRVVLVGAPNSGKSTLLNALAQREVAIVSEEAGTTRDLIDVAVDLDGYKVIFTDTAGLRDNPDKVEAIGIERARMRMSEADLLLLVSDKSDFELVKPGSVDVLRVHTKCDLCGDFNDTADFHISALTGQGLDTLLEGISVRIRDSLESGDVPYLKLRHVALLEAVRDELREAAEDRSLPVELIAERLRRASANLGRITGHVDVERLLDGIFSRFCIGK